MLDQRNDIDYASTLRADCENCFGLCCVALPYAASSDFARTKGAGEPCSHLQGNFRCGVHNELRQLGFRGCTVYDCFGAGQQVSQHTYKAQSWREVPEVSAEMFEVFPVMRHLYELLWYLNDALARTTSPALEVQLRQALEETVRLTELSAAELLELNFAVHRAEVNQLLLETSELVRSETKKQIKNAQNRREFKRGADLIGAKLKGADLRCVNLRGAYLIAADLRDADLRWADLIGADMRDTDLRGADLSESLFLTQFQINAAKGDAKTKLPITLTHPPHWS
ncbi:oxetanocin A resistance protein [Paenibacillus sp. CAA11]|uniref:pentapeptide repeat-containing protein n=1 Tax=Paenibacillus sp. CAA11 TaxID=1532905 RepID=UPI000D3AD6A0|nr:pentapeptide repeat-containing protein [Paenibacillus sp. CAA11]AWB44582.1 oxetanocin A resistance protein [Paenibacillus sp. CAA11]